jgi:hypothetical protein
VQQPGLYFPFVHIRDDEWLKVAAIYWPSIRRLVPLGYATHDSPTAKEFFSARILMDEDPHELLGSMAWDLVQALRENAELLVRDYSLNRARADWNGRSWAESAGPHWEVPALGWIHGTKFPPGVVDFLEEVGLARRGRQDWAWRDPGLPTEWIGLHPALAGAYMTVLAGRLSEHARFEPLTDQADLRVATPNSDVGAALNLLLGRRRGAESAGKHETAGVDEYVMLALQHVRPTNLANIPAEKIVKLRHELAEELAKFRDYVEGQRSELTQIATLPIRRRRMEAFAEHVERTVELPLRQLERGLLLHRLEPTRSFILAESFVPPAAATGALNAAGASPTATAATGAVVAIGSAWWQVTQLREAARTQSPVGFLLDVRDQLTPRTMTARIRKLLHGSYG